MTPEEFIAEVVRLIVEGKDEEALDFGSEMRDEMMPKLSAEQFVRVIGLMEGAQLVVDMFEAERAQRAEEPPAAVRPA